MLGFEHFPEAPEFRRGWELCIYNPLSPAPPVEGSAVTFDVWSTLLEINSFYRAVAKALSERTGRREEEEYENILQAYTAVKAARRKGLIDEHDIVRSSMEHALRNLPGVNEQNLYWAFSRAVNAVDARSLVLEGAEEVLRLFRESGYSLGVVSNVMFWPGYLTRVILDRAGLSGYFEVQVYADEVKCLKPNPKIFAVALDLLRAEREKSAHVGDSVFEDLAGALASGMAAVLIDKNSEERIIVRKQRFAIVNSLVEVPEAVASLIGTEI